MYRISFVVNSSDGKFTAIIYQTRNEHSMKISHIIILSIVLFFGTGCNKGNTEEMGNGLIIEDLVVGEGAEAQDYNKVVVNYTGSLEDGSVFDSSLNPGRGPFTFTLGVGSVIKGWDLGVKGMKVGGKRKLTIPPELGYGDQGASVIPPGATLIFEVDLLEVEVY